MTRILGISAFYHDSAAALVEDGTVVAACQEERFTRIKNDSSYPAHAIQACLEAGGIEVSGLDWVVFYEKPFSKFERLLETYLEHAPRGLASYRKAMPLWIADKLWIKDRLRRELGFPMEILFADHHESHAASAFYASPFESAAILTVDGVGEWTTTALGRGSGNNLELLQEIRFPHSLGLLYSTFTYYLGFKVNDGEYKVMGLAPYGKPVHAERILNELIFLEEDGSFRLNSRYFEYETGLRMASRRFCDFFGRPPRAKDSPLEQFHMDLAASIQRVTEEALLRMCRHLHSRTGEPDLCMAGGVALNCVANGRILRQTGFRRLWVQPAAGDAGGALGAALAVWFRHLEKDRRVNGSDLQQASLLGRGWTAGGIVEPLLQSGAVYERLEAGEKIRRVAKRLAEGAVVGWFQGRSEYGPRALGNRSILADPRHPETMDEVNRRIKYRESFRPFAPIVPVERAAEYFELDSPSPYMLLVAPVRPECRSRIPAVTHVDGSARIQTVDRADHPDLYDLLTEFDRLTGCPVLLNTSFNVRGEPIVDSPGDAYRCFMRTGIDLLVLEEFALEKTDQPDGLSNWRAPSPVPQADPQSQGSLSETAEQSNFRRAPGQLRRLLCLPWWGFQRLGRALGRFNNAILMALSFFLLLWPTGLFRRLVHRRDPSRGWIARDPLDRGHYRRQY